MLKRLNKNKALPRMLVSGVLASALCVGAHAADTIPSVMAKKSPQSLLLDIERVGKRLLAVGERGHILVSEDKGQTWQQRAVPVSQTLTAVDFVDAKNGWAVGHDSHVLHSNDGGLTWKLQRPGLEAQANLNEEAVKDTKAIALKIKTMHEASEAPGEETITADLGFPSVYTGMDLVTALDEAQWQAEKAADTLKAGPVPPPLMNVWFANKKQGFIVGAFGSAFKTLDGGESWVDISDNIGNKRRYHLNAIIGNSQGEVFIAGEAGFIVKSADNGKTWQQLNLDYDGTIFTLLSSANGDRIIASGLRGNTFASFDHGQTFAVMNTGVDYSLAGGALLKNGDVALAGSGGTIAYSHDGGQTFEQHTLPSRSSISGLLSTSPGELVLVGQGGVHHFSVDNDNN